MLALIDNYDSFTYNIYQYLVELADDRVEVFRNDSLSVDELARREPRALVISPGPGRPEDAGITVEAIRRLAGKIPILGVCLGHQAICAAFGGKIAGARRIVHGKAEPVSHDGRGLFRTLPNPSSFVRYHSLAVREDSLPDELEISARSADGEVMGLRHKRFPIEGVQFHPESAGSESGKRLVKNFLFYRREPFAARRHLETLVAGQDLEREVAAGFMEELTDGTLSDAQIAGFLVAFSAKGPTAEEIAGCADVLRRKRIQVAVDFPLLDTCGTGGDGRGTFNISSLSALVAAAAGAKVAKHGNRAVSSRAGSADFYKALGIPIDGGPEAAVAGLHRHGFAFLFAPNFHDALKYAAQARRELGVKTLLNLLGPLVNPAGAAYQLIGVYSRAYQRPVAEAAAALGVKRAWVVHSHDGLDEISPAAPTRILKMDAAGGIREDVFDPESLGITGLATDELSGGGAEDNAAEARALIGGRGRRALREAVLLNAGAALCVYGLVPDIAAGYRTAAATIDQGRLAALVGALTRQAPGSEAV